MQVANNNKKDIERQIFQIRQENKLKLLYLRETDGVSDNLISTSFVLLNFTNDKDHYPFCVKKSLLLGCCRNLQVLLCKALLLFQLVEDLNKIDY